MKIGVNHGRSYLFTDPVLWTGGIDLNSCITSSGLVKKAKSQEGQTAGAAKRKPNVHCAERRLLLLKESGQRNIIRHFGTIKEWKLCPQYPPFRTMLNKRKFKPLEVTRGNPRKKQKSQSFFVSISIRWVMKRIWDVQDFVGLRGSMELLSR